MAADPNRPLTAGGRFALTAALVGGAVVALLRIGGLLGGVPSLAVGAVVGLLVAVALAGRPRR